MSGWQPIETAPKDGTIIDLWVVCSPAWRPPNGEWDRYADCSFREGRWREFNIQLGEWISIEDENWTVTHWMPLPEPPQ